MSRGGAQAAGPVVFDLFHGSAPGGRDDREVGGHGFKRSIGTTGWLRDHDNFTLEVDRHPREFRLVSRGGAAAASAFSPRIATPGVIPRDLRERVERSMKNCFPARIGPGKRAPALFDGDRF